MTKKPTLDPDSWEAFSKTAHGMLDDVIAKMQTNSEGRVWSPLPDALKQTLAQEVPQSGSDLEDVRARLAEFLPYGVGNTHPRFFGWVHGAGSPSGLLAEMVATAMNANLGGRDHGAIYVERQVVDWSRQMMGFPEGSSGLITSGTSMATIVALKVARDRALGFANRRTGPAGACLVGYASEQAHACVGRAFDMLGLGSDALRRIPVDEHFQMDLGALRDQIDADWAASLTPFCIVGTAGSVNVGSIDDLGGIADIAQAEDLWFHVDGAFGASGILSDAVRPKLTGMERADSLAFDYHKWMHVNYDAGCVLVRAGASHLKAFSDRPEYLSGADRGLAAGAPWPVDYGPELSRGFRALKIWAHLREHGTERLGAAITMNFEQAQFLADLVRRHPELRLMAPVALNIVCFRFEASDEVNDEIVLRLQEQGLAVPSTTKINGRLAIRVNLTNHRTRHADLQFLVDQVVALGGTLRGASLD